MQKTETARNRFSSNFDRVESSGRLEVNEISLDWHAEKVDQQMTVFRNTEWAFWLRSAGLDENVFTELQNFQVMEWRYGEKSDIENQIDF